MRSRGTLALQVALSMSVGAGLTCVGPARASNFLVVIADDLGADKVRAFSDYSTGTYGGQFLPASPTVDQLAAAGLSFTNAWANPLCSPTRAGLLTGQFPYHTQVGHPINTPEDTQLDPTILTLPEALSAVGYESGLFGKWHLGFEGAAGTVDWDASIECASGATVYEEDANPLVHGFDAYVGSVGGDVESFTGWARLTSRGDGTTASCVDATNYPDELYASEAAAWINARTGPFLAVVAFNAPHTDGDGVRLEREWGDLSPACQATVTGSDRCARVGTCGDTDGDTADDGQDILYKYQVQCMDQTLHDLLESIDPVVLDDTLIVFLGDNGTPGNSSGIYNDEEDPYTRSVQSLDGSVRYGKGTAFLTGVRVPFVVADGASWAEVESGRRPTAHLVARPGRASSRDIVVEDVFGTLVTLAGAAPAVVDGGDFSECLSTPSRSCGAATLGARPQFAEIFEFDPGGVLETGRAVLGGSGYRLPMEYDATNACMYPSLYARADAFDEADVYSTATPGTILELKRRVKTMGIGWMPSDGAGGIAWCR